MDIYLTFCTIIMKDYITTATEMCGAYVATEITTLPPADMEELRQCFGEQVKKQITTKSL